MNHHPYLATVIDLVQQAGASILPFWRSTIAVQHKADNSPVTAADLAAHQLLLQGLTQLDPQIPVLSEEGVHLDYKKRQQWQRWWLVDPLDGTKEFIRGSSEFTVNVALIERGQVIFGVVGVPAQNTLYYGGKDLGAYKINNNERPKTICARHAPLESISVIASRSHSNPQQEAILQAISQRFLQTSVVNTGSSLKFCLLAQGLADIYPRFVPTSQWDTAAAQGVLEGAGGSIFAAPAQRLAYEAQQSLLNPSFIAFGQKAPWQQALLQLAEQP